jgi:fucose permease
MFPPILLFFVFFVVGRGIAPIFSRFLSENRMLMLNLLIILGGMIVLLLAKDIFTLSIGASIAGFGTSSIFPTNVSRFTKTFGATASRRATPLFVFGTLGAAFTTQMIGFLSNKFNDLNIGMFTLLGSVLILIILQIGLSLRSNKRHKI